ncbi:MAG: Rrf2 family transcriptional regulator [Myxococcota bacterium]
MQLTRYTDYSLRVLMYLAAMPGELTRIEDISDAYGISRGHVMKVVRGLANEGYVESLRGRGGGVKLARSADDISLGEVVRATEENLALVECFGPGSSGHCVIEPACGLQGALSAALDAFLATLDAYTLGDLMTKRRAMTRLLEIA